MRRFLFWIVIAGIFLYIGTHPNEAADTAEAFGDNIADLATGFGNFLANLAD
jgi:hypothetical protein